MTRKLASFGDKASRLHILETSKFHESNSCLSELSCKENTLWRAERVGFCIFVDILEYFFQDEDAKFFKSLGLNCIRIPFNYRHFEGKVFITLNVFVDVHSLCSQMT